eukprot:223715-Chlamydomonas_euryale.AAC.1
MRVSRSAWRGQVCMNGAWVAHEGAWRGLESLTAHGTHMRAHAVEGRYVGACDAAHGGIWV